MLKRIEKQHLTVGMYVHEFCGSWMDHPFWRTRFLLTNREELAQIQATSIRECWIDTDKGLDIASGTHAVSRAEVDAQIDADFQRMESLPTECLDFPAASLQAPEPASLSNELEQAATICRSSKAAVVAMFREARMGHVTDMVRAHNVVEEISASVLRKPSALVSLARLKTVDDYTYMHSVAVCALMLVLARQLRLDPEQTRLAGLAGLLHDLGKAVIPLAVLNKPGKLTDEEFALVRRHPVDSFEMLQAGGQVPAAVLDACLHHHEKMDGMGYPDRQQGEDISVLARMTAICDVYDAITSDRPYKRGWDPAEALHRMAEWGARHFDQRLFHAFVKSMGIYPVGSLVRLTSGRIGVVTEQAPNSLTTPCVKVFFCTRTDQRIAPQLLNLAAPECSERIVAREDPEHWHFADLNALWSDGAQIAW